MANDNVELGRRQAYPELYDPSLLVAIPRSEGRAELQNTGFQGVDIWTCYELSWLDEAGKPRVAIAEVEVPADSPNIIESKSFKYYLNSLNQYRVASQSRLQQVLERDLTDTAGSPVKVRLFDLDGFTLRRASAVDLGVCLDELQLSEPAYCPEKSLLALAEDCEVTQGERVWCSHLLKSNCPVTGQPDWASVWIGVRGAELCPQSLLRYIVSFRQHQGFHENCVERIYSDLSDVFKPESLWVYARYTRRGGLDINPFRSSLPMKPPAVFGARQ